MTAEYNGEIIPPPHSCKNDIIPPKCTIDLIDNNQLPLCNVNTDAGEFYDSTLAQRSIFFSFYSLLLSLIIIIWFMIMSGFFAYNNYIKYKWTATTIILIILFIWCLITFIFIIANMASSHSTNTPNLIRPCYSSKYQKIVKNEPTH